MKLANAKSGWVTEGMFITLLPLGKPVGAAAMLAYYGLTRADPRYDELNQASRYSRAVLMKSAGNFVIVPVTHEVTDETPAL